MRIERRGIKPHHLESRVAGEIYSFAAARLARERPAKDFFARLPRLRAGPPFSGLRQRFDRFVAAIVSSEAARPGRRRVRRVSPLAPAARLRSSISPSAGDVRRSALIGRSVRMDLLEVALGIIDTVRARLRLFPCGRPRKPFVLTNDFAADILPCMSSPLVRAVQRAYPQIYLACHVDHVRTKSNRYHLSAHDSSLLAHLDETTPTVAGRLAQHLGISNSTLSAALKRLEALGYVARRTLARDRRQVELRLTPAGAEAMSASSVLDARRIARVLENLPPAQQRRAVAGLELLARAALAFQAAAPRRKRW